MGNKSRTQRQQVVTSKGEVLKQHWKRTAGGHQPKRDRVSAGQLRAAVSHAPAMSTRAWAGLQEKTIMRERAPVIWDSSRLGTLEHAH